MHLSSRVGLLLSLLAASAIVLVLTAATLLRSHSKGEGSPFQRVAKNSVFPMATSFLNKFLDLAFAVYMLRALGPEGVGRYTFAVVVIGYLDIVTNFGLGTLLTREVAANRDAGGRYLGNTLVLRVALWALSLPLVALLLGPAAAPLGVSPDVAQAIVLLLIGLLPSLASGALSAVFMAHERFEYPAAVTVLTTLLKVALGTGVLMAGWGFVGLAAVSVLVNIATLAVLARLLAAQRYMWSPCRSETPASETADSCFHRVFAPDLRFCWQLLRLSYPLMLNNLLNSIFFRVDSLMIKPMLGDTALGWYGTAYKVVDGLGIISSSFTLALFPLLSQYARSAPDSLARTFGLGIKLLLIASLPISVGTTLIAPEIILLFAGPDYLPHSAIALQLLIWFLPFSFVNGLTQYLLIALNQQQFITFSFGLATSFNLVANLLLIPRLGYAGAAITTILSEWVLMVPFWYCVRREMPPIPVPQIAWRPMLAAGIMGMEVWALRSWNLPAAVGLAPLVYLAGLFALRSFDAKELALLADLLPSLRLNRWQSRLFGRGGLQ